MVAIATTWMRRLAANPVSFSVQYHADQHPDELQRFWGELLGLSNGQIRFQRKSNSAQLASRTWRCRYGVLTVTADDTYLRHVCKRGWTV